MVWKEAFITIEPVIKSEQKDTEASIITVQIYLCQDHFNRHICFPFEMKQLADIEMEGRIGLLTLNTWIIA